MCYIDHVVFWVFEVCDLTNTERRIKIAFAGFGKIDRKIVMIRNAVDSLQLWVQRRHAPRIPGFYVHERAIEIADFLLVGALREVACCRFLDDRFHIFLRFVSQQVEGAVS